jgi:colanic acid/amylovoran biosynthesis glycosyltransferase
MVTQFLPVSQNLALELKQKFKIKPHQIRVMPLGIDLKKYLFKPKTKLSKSLKLGIAARLVEYKGVDDLLKAGQLLKKRGQNFEIHIIGSGPDEKKLKNLVNKLEISKNVIWHGWLKGKSLINKLRTLDVYVAPYKTARDGAKDSMTMILKEVMALGIPVVSTTNSAIPELMTHEKHGLLVPEKNPVALSSEIENLIENKKLKQRIVIQARKRIQKDFNLKNQTQHWLLLKLFQNL